MIEGLILALLLIQLGILGVLAFSNARLWVEIKAMQKSTHQIQFIDPLEALREQKLSKEEERDMVQDPLKSLI